MKIDHVSVITPSANAKRQAKKLSRIMLNNNLRPLHYTGRIPPVKEKEQEQFLHAVARMIEYSNQVEAAKEAENAEN